MPGPHLLYINEGKLVLPNSGTETNFWDEDWSGLVCQKELSFEIWARSICFSFYESKFISVVSTSTCSVSTDWFNST